MRTTDRLFGGRQPLKWVIAAVMLLGLAGDLWGQQRPARGAQQLVPVYLADPLQIDTTYAAIRAALEATRDLLESNGEALSRLEGDVVSLKGMMELWLPLLLVVNVLLLLMVGYLYAKLRLLGTELKEQKSLREVAISRLMGVEQGLQQIQLAGQKPARSGSSARKGSRRKR